MEGETIPQTFAQEAPFLLDQGQCPATVIVIVQNRLSGCLSQGVHRPGQNEAADLFDHRRRSRREPQTEAGDGMELRQGTQDDDIGRAPDQEAIHGGYKIGKRLVNDEDRIGVAPGGGPDRHGRAAQTRGIVGPADENDFIALQMVLQFIHLQDEAPMLTQGDLHHLHARQCRRDGIIGVRRHEDNRPAPGKRPGQGIEDLRGTVAHDDFLRGNPVAPGNSSNHPRRPGIGIMKDFVEPAADKAPKAHRQPQGIDVGRKIQQFIL